MIYVFLADGFEEIEALAPVDILRRAEFDVTVVGVNSSVVKGSHGISIVVDKLINEVSLDNIEMIVLPGGMPGTLNLEKSEQLKMIINHCIDNNILIGLICAAPTILGRMNLLHNRKVTVFPGFESQLLGAEISDESIVVDKNVITAKGAGVSIEFGLKLVEALTSVERAELLGASLQCKK